MKKTDEKLKKTLIDQLYWDNRIDVSDIKVDVTDRRVILTGSVPNYAASEAALIVAWNTQGVIQVDNKLEIRYPTEAKIPTDSDIKERIKQLLSWTDGMSGQTIKVSVEAGVVNVHGTVDSYWKKRKVGELASHIFGVVKVENTLAVVPGRSIRDEVIARDIISALERSRIVAADDITIKVKEGIVRVSGAVADLRVYHSVLDFAGRTSGVVDVRSELKVQ